MGDMKYWFSWKLCRIRAFFTLIKRLPKFYRLNLFWDVDPAFYGDVIRNYCEVMCELTGGKLKKPSHDSMTVIEEVWKYMNTHYAGWRSKEEEKKEN